MNLRLILAAGAALSLLSVAACNRETEADAMAADESAMDASTVEEETVSAEVDRSASGGGASTETADSSEGMASDTASAAETMSGGAPATAVPGSTQEQMELTRETLSPAGASSGPTAPRPQ